MMLPLSIAESLVAMPSQQHRLPTVSVVVLAHTSDIVDGLVVATALRLDPLVVTSDP